MTRPNKSAFVFTYSLVLLVCSAILLQAATETPPPLSREFRGVWVATVANIDWPPKKGLSTAEQKAAMVKIMDEAVAMHLNAVVLQVRSQCDAIYKSSLEPWSPSLTGKMGQAPSPYYDPLDFAIAEAHKRGLELHAWCNPFRAGIKAYCSNAPASHVTRQHPEFTLDYGKMYWLNPNEPAAQNYSYKVVMDIVHRYDVDGIHFDDYFFPYKEEDANKKDMPFPDEPTYQRYVAHGGKMDKPNWRRANVDAFVKRVHDGIKQQKPWVKFGIAPFGIWKNGVPVKVKATDSYDTLFADARKWMLSGWLDYSSPQLYWRVDYPERSYATLLHWWAQQNTLRRHVWPGLYDSAVNEPDKELGGVKITTNDIVRQVQIARNEPGVSGTIHYSMVALEKNRGGLKEALAPLYAQPALVPASPWLGYSAVKQPTVKISHGDHITAKWSGGGRVWQWAVQKNVNGNWTTQIFPASQTSCIVKEPATVIAVTAIDRVGNASQPAIVRSNQ
ncbi:MAG: glycoside hydrolase family 10 protein [Limisphaerales bacterium]